MTLLTVYFTSVPTASPSFHFGFTFTSPPLRHFARANRTIINWYIHAHTKHLAFVMATNQ